MSEFDPSKPVMTRGGRAAFILKADMKGIGEPIVGYVVDDSGEAVLKRWHKDGRTHLFFEHASDLVNIPESKWMNLYADPDSSRVAAIWSDSRASADGVAELRFKESGARRVAIVEWTAADEFINTKLEASNAK